MASAWETISRDRRQEPRYKVSLRASVSVIEAATAQDHGDVVLAQTSDVSRGGLSLVLFATRLGPYNLGEGEHSVLIVLALPSGDSVKLAGRLAYCTPLKPDDPAAGCLAGIQITELSADDRAVYDEFIDSL
ncbi:MAG TPA: PilZ domain-containing protein [Pyrinomonadaceae bacterium]|nr:PilZ domain-containing protein [Pyrinomonadaceae bacterium]